MDSTRTTIYCFTIRWNVFVVSSQHNSQHMKLLTECQNDKHKPRDNNFGVTWCVRCGRLFSKPCGKELQESDKILIKNKHMKPKPTHAEIIAGVFFALTLTLIIIYV